MFPRVFSTAFAGVTICAGSFFGTLAIMDFVAAPSAHLVAEQADEVDTFAALKTALIYDAASLDKAAGLAKLQISANLKGALDVLERQPDGLVHIAGWAADVRGGGAPVRILAFAKGKPILEAETSGERPDVTTALNLEPSVARNVKFDVKMACNRSEALVVAMATKKNAYAPLKTTVCP